MLRKSSKAPATDSDVDMIAERMAEAEIANVASGSSIPLHGSKKRKQAASSDSASLSTTAILFMLLLSLQFSLQPFLAQKYISTGQNSTVLLMIQEFLKTFLAGILLFLSLSTSSLQAALNQWSPSSFCRVAGVPSLLYAIQNKATMLAYSNLDSVTFNTLNQTKTISAAFWCWAFMGKRQSIMQCGALGMLMVAGTIIEGTIDGAEILRSFSEEGVLATLSSLSSASLSFLSSSSSSASSSAPLTDRFAYGILPCLLASLISGLAGALSQFFMSGAKGRNAYMYSMELSFATFTVLAVSLGWSEDGGVEKVKEGLMMLRLET